MARKVASKKKLQDEAKATEKASKKVAEKASKKVAGKTSKKVAEKTSKKVAEKTPKKKAKGTKKKKASPKETVVRLKAFWGVFNQSLKRVAIFEYCDRKKADKKATDSTKSAKSPHFVQVVKDVIQD